MSYQYPYQNPLMRGNDMQNYLDTPAVYNPSAQNQLPTGKDLSLGNLRNSSPGRYNSQMSGNDHSPHRKQSFGSPQNSYSEKRYGFNLSPLEHQPSMGMQQQYNTPHAYDSPTHSPSMMGMGSMPSLNHQSSLPRLHNRHPTLNGSSLINPISMSNNDILTASLNSMGLNVGPLNGSMPSPYMHSPYKNQSSVYNFNQEMLPQPVDNFLDRQNQVMARILQDVETYKRMELSKQQAMMMNPYSNRMDGFGSPMSGSPVPMRGRLGSYGSLYQLPDMPMPSMQSMQGMQGMPGMQSMPGMTPMQSMQNQMQPPVPDDFQDYEPDSPIRNANKKTSIVHVRNGKFNGGTVFEDPNKQNSGSERSSPEKQSRSPPSKSTKGDKEPKKKRLTQKVNKGKARRTLRIMGWKLALPGLWFLSVAKWAEQRRQTETKLLEDEIPNQLESFVKFATESIEKEIKNFSAEKNSMVIVQPPNVSPLKPAEMEKRCRTITDHLIIILDHLSLQLDSGKLTKDFFKFLAKLSEDDAVIPEDFLSGFEIDRLQFNMYGNLRHMDEWRSKMVLSTFLLIEGLLFFVMMSPWGVIASIKEKSVNIKNVFNAGSVFYHIILDLFREVIPTTHHEEGDLPFEVNPPILAAMEPAQLSKLDVLPDKNHNDTQEVISSFYSKERLNAFFKDRPAMVKEVKDAIVDFIDVIYDQTHNILPRKWHVKQAFHEFRP